MAFEAANKNLHAARTRVLLTFGNHESAEIAAANLAVHGIDSWVSADDCGGLMPVMADGGVKLIVRLEDMITAKALLDAMPKLECPVMEEQAAVKADEPPPDLPKFVIVAGIWVLFGVRLITNIMSLYSPRSRAMSEMGKFVYFWFVMGISVLCIYMLYQSFKNYLIHKNRQTDGGFAE